MPCGVTRSRLPASRACRYARRMLPGSIALPLPVMNTRSRSPLLFQIITAREERASIACASNTPFSASGG